MFNCAIRCFAENAWGRSLSDKCLAVATRDAQGIKTGTVAGTEVACDSEAAVFAALGARLCRVHACVTALEIGC